MERPLADKRPFGPFAQMDSREPDSVQCSRVEVERLESSDDFNYEVRCLDQAEMTRSVFKIDSFAINEDHPAAFGSTPAGPGIILEIGSTADTSSITVTENSPRNVNIEL